MDFALTEEQTLVQRTTREFAQLLRENGRQSEADGPSATLRRQYEALELGRLDWCAQAGGADLGSLMKALVVEELAAGCAGSTLALDHATLGYYGAVQAGPRGIELAKRAASDDGFVIAVHVDVDKQLSVDDGRLRADIAYVPARPPSALFIVGEQLWLVDDGIEATAVKSCGLGAAGGCALKVDAEATAVEGSAQQLLAHSRIYIAACLVGVARAAHEYALAYTLEREAFGRKVAHHQGIAFMLAENRVRLDAARVLCEQSQSVSDTQFAVVGMSAETWQYTSWMSTDSCAQYDTNCEVLVGAFKAHGVVAERGKRQHARGVTLGDQRLLDARGNVERVAGRKRRAALECPAQCQASQHDGPQRHRVHRVVGHRDARGHARVAHEADRRAAGRDAAHGAAAERHASGRLREREARVLRDVDA